MGYEKNFIVDFNLFIYHIKYKEVSYYVVWLGKIIAETQLLINNVNTFLI